MSARYSRCAYPSSQRKKLLLDLNVTPSDNTHSTEVDVFPCTTIVPETQAVQQISQPPPVTIDVDSIVDDDDVVVVLPPPRAVDEARNNSRHRRAGSNVVVVDLESETANNRNKRPRAGANQPFINCESYVVRDTNYCAVNEYGWNMAPPQMRMIVAPPPPPIPAPIPPPEPEFNCPICMGPLVEEMSTKCGHIFCKECIKKALSFQHKCPTCRKKVTFRGTIRVFLPKTSS